MKVKAQASSSPVLVKNGAGGFLTFLVRSLVNMANDPTNKKFFLPIFLSNIKVDGGKSLVPFNTHIDAGPLPALKSQVSSTVCNAGWAPHNNYNGGFATNDPKLDVTAVTINGLNNAEVTSYSTFAPNTAMQYAITFTAKMNAYTPTTAKIPVSDLSFNPASFSFGVTCESKDHKHTDPISATGTFEATVKQATISLAVLITLNEDLTASVSIPTSFTPAGGSAMPGISITFGTGSNGLVVSKIKLSGNNPLNAVWNPMINQAFSDPGTITKIEKMFNETLVSDGVRNPVAKAVEDQFNKLINDLK